MKKIERRFVRFNKKKKEKELLALSRKENEVRKLSSIPIEYVEIKPIRIGFTRTFKLRDDLKGRPDFKYLQEALNACNVEQFCRNKQFKYPKYYREKEFKLKNIYEYNYKKLSDKAKELFLKTEKLDLRNNIYTVYIPNIPFWMLSIKVKAKYIHYFKKYNNNLISEYNKLYNKIYYTEAYYKINHLLDISKEKDYYTNNKKYKIKKQEEKEAFLEAKEYFNEQ